MCPGCGAAGLADCLLILLVLTSVLGWYAIYRVWKQYYHSRPFADALHILGLLGRALFIAGYVLFIAAVGFCTYLLAIAIYYTHIDSFVTLTLLVGAIETLGWYVVYRAVKHYFRREPIASPSEAIRSPGFWSVIALVVACILLPFAAVRFFLP